MEISDLDFSSINLDMSYDELGSLSLGVYEKFSYIEPNKYANMKLLFDF